MDGDDGMERNDGGSSGEVGNAMGFKGKLENKLPTLRIVFESGK